MFGYAILALLVLSVCSYLLCRNKAKAVAQGDLSKLHSRPSYHGFYSFLWTSLAGLSVLIIGTVLAYYYMNYSLKQSLPEHMKQFPLIQQEQIIDYAIGEVEKRIVPAAETEEDKQVRRKLSETYSDWKQVQLFVIPGFAILAALITFLITYYQISLHWRARNRSEHFVVWILTICAGIAILTTVGIVLALIGPTLKFFSDIPLYKFLFGTQWSPLAGVFEGKVNEDNVGAIPLFAGTFMIAFIAMAVAVPIGLLAAVYLSDYAGSKVRSTVKPILEILAGIPTVVFGFFAALTVAPFIRDYGDYIIYFSLFLFAPLVITVIVNIICKALGRSDVFEKLESVHFTTLLYALSFGLYSYFWIYHYDGAPSFGLEVASESALAAGIVMGIMIIPFISSLSDDVITAVPQSLRDGSYGVGATKAETLTKVVLPAALPGIVSAILLAFSRAVGETMIVVMAAGQGANLTWNPLEAMTTVTVQIVALITGDTEAETAAGPAFALGFTLFAITLALNIVALMLVQKYRQKYD